MRPFCVPCKAQARQSLAGCGQGAPHNIQAPAPKMALRSVVKGPRSQGDALRGLPGKKLRHQMFKLWLDCWGAKTVQRLATTVLPQQLVYLRAGDANDTAVRRGQADGTGGR